ncbi:BMP-binding endothelial regulator protein-like [Lytechinus variegatus]|uniref:BMP-binding endothelial regulator protein-like n=1 Tax=Lytechinus variegatus TaxID=7654 RepID=UPI001BB18A48|nr:BMP-binding endothelial regulator protein-like [Lytechinus variegatus]
MTAFWNNTMILLPCLPLIFVLLSITQVYSFINSPGSKLVCEREGEEVTPSILKGNPCISCFCRNKEVVCRREVCEDLVDCALVITTLGVDCCEKCKGCRYNGDIYNSGDTWTAHDDPCRTFQCREGVITASVTQCEPIDCPFGSQVLPGQCCPSCTGCFVDGRLRADGEKFSRDSDPCTECVCENGRVTCSKQTCPVLSCPEYQVETPEGKCCPKCVAQRKVFDLGDRCLFRNNIFDAGQTVFKDKCTKCVCLESTVMCHRETCPSALNCPSGNVVQGEDDCCPRCEPLVCDVNGTKYQDGDVWHQSVCESCSCNNGLVRCRVEECRLDLECETNFELKTLEGDCCPQCIEKNGVCTVFGDPHYRSFDGRLFNFQGRCKYLLAADCSTNDFRVRVRNDGRNTKSFSWTKTVFLTLGKHSITLLQDYVVRVNRETITVPYSIDTAFRIYKDSYNVIVETNIGIILSWDGDSFVELSVPPQYKSKMCGLCGNYNGDRHDDLRTLKGEFTNDVRTFGESWRVGGNKFCDRTVTKALKYSCWDDSVARRRAQRACRTIKSKTFQPCHDVVDLWVYYRSCLTDMCECQEDRLCSCEAESAYIRECRRQGVELNYTQNALCSDMS